MLQGLELRPDPTATSTAAAPLRAVSWLGVHIRLHLQRKGVLLKSLKTLACADEFPKPGEGPPAPSDCLCVRLVGRDPNHSLPGQRVGLTYKRSLERRQ